MSTFRRQLTPFLRDDSPYKKYSPVVMDYTPPHSYDAIAPADEATVPSQHDEYQIGTLNIKHTASGVYYTRITDFEEVRPGQWINHGIPEGAAITVEYLLTDDAGDGAVRLEWEGVGQPSLSTWNFTGTGIASIGVFEGKLRFVLEGGGGGGGVVDILGEYDPAVTYMAGDVIVYDNALWTVLNDSTIGITPVEGTDYTQIAVMGLDGNTILYGAVPPTGGIGANGDFYIDTVAKMIYGPKASGAWPSGTSIVGPQGIQGVPGSRWWSGDGPPAGSLGVIQDWYLNDANGDVYEKTGATTWTLKDNLRGPEGSGGGGGSGVGGSIVQLDANQMNSTTSFADITGLSFGVEAGKTYRFTAYVVWDTPATTTSAAFSVNGPASPTLLSWHGRTFNSSGGGITTNNQTTYDAAAIATTAAYTTNNLAMIEGIIKPSVDGTVTIRFRSETAGQQITVKAGSTIEYATGQHLAGGGPFIDVVGEYDPGLFYNAGQAVYYDNALWAAILDNTIGITPVEGTNWTKIAIQGPQGDQGDQGEQGETGETGETGVPGYTTTTADFTQPASGSNVSAVVESSAWAAVGVVLYIPVGGYYQISGIPDATHIAITNLGYSGNAAAGATIASGKRVLAAGVRGPTGPQGIPGDEGPPGPQGDASIHPVGGVITSGTAAATDKESYYANCASDDVTLTLPAAASVPLGKRYNLKKVDGTTNRAILAAAAGEGIDGVSSVDTQVPNDVLTVEKFSSTGWYIVTPITIFPALAGEVTGDALAATIEGVSNPGGNIDVFGTGGVVVTGNDSGNSIQIDGSGVAAEQALADTIEGVANPGGDIEIVGAGGLVVTGDNTLKRITLDATLVPGTAVPGSGSEASGIDATPIVSLGAISDEFDSDTLNSKWTMLGGLTTPVAGVVDWWTNPAAGVYDLTSRGKGIQLQPRQITGNADEIYMRCPGGLANNESVVVSLNAPHIGTTGTDLMMLGIGMSTVNTPASGGTWRSLFLRGTATYKFEYYNLSAVSNLKTLSQDDFLGRRFLLRVTRRNTNDYYFHYSFDGKAWNHLHKETIATTFSYFFIQARSQMTPSFQYAVFTTDWIRHVANANYDPW